MYTCNLNQFQTNFVSWFISIYSIQMLLHNMKIAYLNKNHKKSKHIWTNIPRVYLYRAPSVSTAHGTQMPSNKKQIIASSSHVINTSFAHTSNWTWMANQTAIALSLTQHTSHTSHAASLDNNSINLIVSRANSRVTPAYHHIYMFVVSVDSARADVIPQCSRVQRYSAWRAWNKLYTRRTADY